MSLKFTPSNHRYYLDRKPCPGVTTLLGKGLPKPALVYWSAKCVAEYVADNPEGVEQLRGMGRGPMVAALKETPWQKRDEAAVRGTDVHALAEQVVHGKPVEVPAHLVDHVEGYARWLDAFDVQPLLTERSVGNRKWWYAGRFDFLGSIRGVPVLADWKTSSGVYGETALQLAAYRGAEFYVNDDDPDTEHPMPEVEALAVVHVTAGGTRHHMVTDPEQAWKAWTHVQWVAKQTDVIKNFLGEAVEAPDQENAA